ncbi:cysteine desulfurase [Candidatus Saccharibacteria bacterium]|nr:cysteine desulfurase [Candidatus Saccharibacteria bacterium]
MKQLYFDYAAATPVSTVVQAAMAPYLTDNFYNPSALYLNALNVKKLLDAARQDVAGILGAKASEIIFTAGGTEANNLAIQGIMRNYSDSNCIVSSIEHESVLLPADLFYSKQAPVKPDGRIDVNQLVKLIDSKTVLISVMYASNEIGTVQPLSEISKRIKEIRRSRQKSGNHLPLVLHTDACQAPNYLPLIVNTLGVDMMTLNGSKIYGPKQSGVLFVHSGIGLQPFILGGGQERNLRSGTQNVAGSIGFAAALVEAQGLREAESIRLKELQQEFIIKLSKQLPKAVVNGSLQYRLPNNLHLTIAGMDNEWLMMSLDERGCMVATGSACSASSDEPSHVLKAIGLSDTLAHSSLRISMGRKTNRKAVNTLLQHLVDLAG